MVNPSTIPGVKSLPLYFKGHIDDLENGHWLNNADKYFSSLYVSYVRIFKLLIYNH